MTGHEVKTIISRAGEGTKMILTGDPDQIDNPYLDSSSNGLSYAIEKLKGQPIFGHITLSKSERSPCRPSRRTSEDGTFYGPACPVNANCFWKADAVAGKFGSEVSHNIGLPWESTATASTNVAGMELLKSVGG